jgi:CubicO group peptidase (beta-lactamase class C family)
MIHSLKFFLRTCLFVISFLASTASLLAQESQVDALIKREMNERRIPGVQVAVVQKGAIVLLKSYGIANIENNIPVDNQTIFAINSCTKAFTGVAIMQLVEAGKVDLSAPISTYLDTLPKTWQPITIMQLLTHVSGLPDILSITTSGPQSLTGQRYEDFIWRKVKEMPMAFKTGTQFSYNQTNYALLGKVIDKVSGNSFVQMFKEKQFQVVGMQHTIFADSRDIVPHFAPTYRYKTEIPGHATDEQVLTHNYAEFPGFLRAGSSINSTAEDLAKWIIALQNGKLFKSKTTLQPLWTHGTYNDGTPTQWTPGWGFTKLRPKHRAVGMTGGGRSAFIVYPDDDLAVVVLTNLGGGTPEDYIEEIAGFYNQDVASADPVTLLRKQLREKGFENIQTVIEKLKNQYQDFVLPETDINDWGYRLLSSGKIKEALALFKLNVMTYPASWNAYDSYGEALARIGERENAINMYEKSIALNPDNKNGKRALEKLNNRGSAH